MWPWMETENLGQLQKIERFKFSLTLSKLDRLVVITY